VKFLAANLLLNTPDPFTGRTKDPHEKLRDAVRWAVWAEEAGFDAVGIGNGTPRRSSPPPRPCCSRIWPRSPAASGWSAR
jgi:hypothetical protein